MCSDIRTSQSVLFLGDYCTETIAAEDNFSYDRPTSFTCESLKARCHQMHAANLNSESLMHLSVELYWYAIFCKSSAASDGRWKDFICDSLVLNSGI